MIKAVFFDIDGVLTDGKVTITEGGQESKTITFDDIDAIFELKRAGIKIGFITAEDNSFSEYVRKRFSPDFFISGCKDKLSAFLNLIKGIPLDASEVCYIGDSKKDIELLEYLKHSFVPSDVDTKVKASAKGVLRAKRGSGVIKEFAEYVLNLNSRKEAE